MRLPPIELDDALGATPHGFEVRADAERRDERHVARGELADGRIVEVIVVVVRDDDDVEGRQRERDGHGLEALGPANGTGDVRSPQTGSVRTRTPSISTSTVEWPSQVARSPSHGARPRLERLATAAVNAASDAAAAQEVANRRHLRIRVAQSRNRRVHVAKLAALHRQKWKPLVMLAK